MNPLNSAPPMPAFLRQALTVLSILFLCVTPTHAACRRISYTSQPHCEEALGNDMVNRPPCSTLNFTVQVIPCELRTSADLVALRAANYRVLPNIPVRLSLTNSDVVKVVDISNSLCWSFSKKMHFSINSRHWDDTVISGWNYFSWKTVTRLFYVICCWWPDDARDPFY